MVGAMQYRKSQAMSEPPVRGSMRGYLSVLCCIGFLATVPKLTEGQQSVFAPSYVYPCENTAGCAWDVFKTGAIIVILNPNSGPGSSSSSFYQDFVNLLASLKTQSSVTTVIGYVSTKYGTRPSSAVIADINTYFSIYKGLDGIFFDEGSTSCSSSIISLYSSYDSQVRSLVSPGFTTLNWGTVGSECFLENTNIDTYCTYEGNYTTYISSAYNSSPKWVYNYDPTGFYHIVYNTPKNTNKVVSAVDLSDSRNAGYIYFTDAIYHTSTDNPYDVAPGPVVWAAEVDEAGNN